MPEDWKGFVEGLVADFKAGREDLVGRALLLLDELPCGKKALLTKDYSSGDTNVVGS